MWLKNMCVFMWSVMVVFLRGECNAITNAQFNASLRDYAVPEDSQNTTEVKTLQKDYQRYAHFTPMSIPVRYKEIPDSALAPSLSHGRGLLHHNHHGYGLADYEDGPHSGYGYEYHFPDDHNGNYDGHHHPDHHHIDLHHDHHSHHPHHDDHKYSYGHHHKHFDHALAAKTVLWPIAGIALLGAAAALVSNPILLQLGVVSGKRRRRDTEEYISDTLPNFSRKDFMRFYERHDLTKTNNYNKVGKGNDTKKDSKDVEKTTRFPRVMRKPKLKIVYPKLKKVQASAVGSFRYSKEFEDKRYIPILLKHKD